MGPCPSARGAFLDLWAGRTPPLDSLTLGLPRGIAEMVHVGAQLCPQEAQTWGFIIHTNPGWCPLPGPGPKELPLDLPPPPKPGWAVSS